MGRSPGRETPATRLGMSMAISVCFEVMDVAIYFFSLELAAASIYIYIYVSLLLFLEIVRENVGL